MKTDKEKWVEEVFKSTEGMVKSVPHSRVFENIQKQIQIQEFPLLPMRGWKMAAAAILLLCTLNIFTLANYMNRSSNTSNNTFELADHSIISNFDFYE